jgi:CRP-like cAMP-binding protein
VRVNGTGATLGLAEVLSDIPRLSDVVADTPIEAFYLTTKVFRHLMQENETVRSFRPNDEVPTS